MDVSKILCFFFRNCKNLESVLNVNNKNILEIGAGTGLVGLSTIMCGAKNIFLTDLAYCLTNLQYNIDMN